MLGRVKSVAKDGRSVRKVSPLESRPIGLPMHPETVKRFLKTWFQFPPRSHLPQVKASGS